LLDQRGGLCTRLAGEAGAEERIDDHVRLAELRLSSLGIDDAHIVASIEASLAALVEDA